MPVTRLRLVVTAIVTVAVVSGCHGERRTPSLDPRASDPDITAQEAALGPANPAAPRTRVLIGAHDPSLGPADALVTIVAFSDFQCPFSQAAAEALHEAVNLYPRDVRVVFKQNPLPYHPNAILAAEAALAAGEQGKFWEYHDLLFGDLTQLDRASLDRHAWQAGLEPTAFAAALDQHTFRAKVAADVNYARALGVRSAPAIFVNGKLVPEVTSLADLRPVIEGELGVARTLVAQGTSREALYASLMRDAGPRVAAPSWSAYQVPLEGSPSLGDADAPLTIVVFGDFQCPYSRHAAATLKMLAAKYGNQLHVVWKNDPMADHPDARLAAEAALAAAAEGKFWAMHDALFAQDDLGRPALERIAARIGLDVPRFRAALDAHTYGAAVDADVALAGRLGVATTPTYLVNGRQVVGDAALDGLQKLCDQSLCSEPASPLAMIR